MSATQVLVTESVSASTASAGAHVMDWEASKPQDGFSALLMLADVATSAQKEPTQHASGSSLAGQIAIEPENQPSGSSTKLEDILTNVPSPHSARIKATKIANSRNPKPKQPRNLQMSDRVSVRLAAMTSEPSRPPPKEPNRTPEITRKRKETDNLDHGGDILVKQEHEVHGPVKKKRKSPQKRPQMLPAVVSSRKGKEKEILDMDSPTGIELQITGETCRFIGIRSFAVALDGKSKPYGEPIFGDEQVRGEGGGARGLPAPAALILPTKWNVPLDSLTLMRLKWISAKHIIPILEAELIHTHKPGLIRRRREVVLRATCDLCMTSMFSQCYVCNCCGREVCLDCLDQITALSAKVTPETRRLNCFKPLICTSKNVDHAPQQFLPVTRFAAGELENAIMDMRYYREVREWETLEGRWAVASEVVADRAESWLKLKWQKYEKILADTPAISAKEWYGDLYPCIIESSSSSTTAVEQDVTPSDGAISATVSPTTQPTPLPVSAYTTDSDTKSPPPHKLLQTEIPPPRKRCDSSADSPPPSFAPSPPQSKPFIPPPDPAGIESLPLNDYHETDFNESTFVGVWEAGEALVVRGLRHKFKLPWTPEYFIEKYRNTHCSIVDCDTEVATSSTVGNFFKKFGQYEERKGCLKLKDWPPQSDFKLTFPDLFEDFHNVVPVPNFTRRDGICNLAAYFPTNAIAPDIGPKMYNAFESSELAGGKGSTRLHMDMADAVNIMLYAAPRRDGSPGSAIWDVYRAEDAEKIRAFLAKYFPEQFYNDPIHSQAFYLDADLRKKLFEEQGVASWRIYQRPGDAVFIPAGCAHQVCNLSDCIKIAIDFVSPQNVERCATLTKQFREQNHIVAWKEDILQLRSMVWYAWLTCTQAEKTLEAEDPVQFSLRMMDHAKAAAIGAIQHLPP